MNGFVDGHLCLATSKTPGRPNLAILNRKYLKIPRDEVHMIYPGHQKWKSRKPMLTPSTLGTRNFSQNIYKSWLILFVINFYFFSLKLYIFLRIPKFKRFTSKRNEKFFIIFKIHTISVSTPCLALFGSSPCPKKKIIIYQIPSSIPMQKLA